MNRERKPEMILKMPSAQATLGCHFFFFFIRRERRLVRNLDRFLPHWIEISLTNVFVAVSSD